MKRNKLIKRQGGGYVAPQDNTKVAKKPVIKPIKLTPEQIKNIQLKKLQESSGKARIYDANKAKYYRNLQNFYNQNVFGYGISGNQTRYDPTTPEGQAAIQQNFDYAKGNATDFLSNVAGVGLTSGASMAGRGAIQLYNRLTKGVFRTPSKNGALGTLKQYSKNPIGGGAEAVVVDNTPTTVGKMTSIPVEEMAARNQIPNTVPSKYIGYVKDRGTKLPTYVQRKLRILTEQTFPRYANKLDRAMEKSGFRRVNDPNVQYRAYTNGQVVVDDVAPGNVGLDWLRRPKMIDFNLQTVPEWTAQGFTLKDGGKLQRMQEGGSFKDIAIGMVPLVGTYQDYKTFKQDPSLANLGWLALSGIGDVLFFTGAGAAIKGIKAARAAAKVRRSIASARSATRQKNFEKMFDRSQKGKQAFTGWVASGKNLKRAQDKLGIAQQAVNQSFKQAGIKIGTDLFQGAVLDTTQQLINN